MSKLDQPLKLKHGLAAVAASLILGAAGTALAGGVAQNDAGRASAANAGTRLAGSLHYRSTRSNPVDANSQEHRIAGCHPGEKVVGGGVKSTAAFSGGGGMMINTSAPVSDDAWQGRVDVFANAGGERITVTAICVG